MKIKLLGKNLDELKRLVAEEGLPGFTAKQIAQWLYVKKVRNIDDMTNLSKAARARLSEKYEVGVKVAENKIDARARFIQVSNTSEGSIQLRESVASSSSIST